MKLFDWLNEDEDAEPPSSPRLTQKLASLRGLTVKQVMKPRALIDALDADVQLRRVRRLKSLKSTYLPVYEGDLDHVRGWIAKARVLELLAEPSDDSRLLEHARPIGFVAEDMPAARLADAFLKAGAPLLIARDAAGVTTGVVSLADLVELIFGFTPEDTIPRANPLPTARDHEL